MKVLKLIVLTPFAVAAIVLAIPFLVVIYPMMLIADVFNVLEERRIEKKRTDRENFLLLSQGSTVGIVRKNEKTVCHLTDGGGI